MKFQTDSICFSLFIYQDGHLIIELHQVGQELLPLGEFLLITIDGFLAIYMPVSSIHKELSHQFPRGQVTVDQPVIPWVLLAFLEDKSDVCSPSVSRHGLI